MQLGRASAFGIAMMVCLGEQEAGCFVSAETIAVATGVPIDYLRKLLQRLVRATVVTSTRGRGGGFCLPRHPRQITLLQIIEAIEGPIDGSTLLFTGDIFVRQSRFNKCINRCRRILASQFSQTLAQTKLADLLTNRT